MKETLKEAGFYFASKKMAWYYRNEMFKKRGDGAPLEVIRTRYGSEKINTRREKNSIEKE